MPLFQLRISDFAEKASSGEPTQSGEDIQGLNFNLT